VNLEQCACLAGRGDRNAFREIVEATGGRLYSLAYHFLGDAAEAQDAVQEAYLRAHLSFSRFAPRGDGSCLAWLRRITLNVCRDWARAKRPVPMEDAVALVDSADLAVAAGLAAGLDEGEGEELRASVRRLPHAYREVVVLRFGQELSYQEMAQVTGANANTVATRLRRALLMLRRDLGDRSDLGVRRDQA
jgi:RNA polymerase sigma-70 factor (ECF subfamily)